MINKLKKTKKKINANLIKYKKCKLIINKIINKIIEMNKIINKIIEISKNIIKYKYSKLQINKWKIK